MAGAAAERASGSVVEIADGVALVEAGNLVEAGAIVVEDDVSVDCVVEDAVVVDVTVEDVVVVVHGCSEHSTVLLREPEVTPPPQSPWQPSHELDCSCEPTTQVPTHPPTLLHSDQRRAEPL